MTESSPFSSLPDQRVIRVFVSSTFRDMHAERDELILRIFPQLRKLCESRGVTWSEVDLRWGITAEQSERGETLPICLAEIQRCRPYFIGLLGERYGWVPDEIPPELIEQHEWLKEHSQHSVTELEILHGVLNDPAMANHALFYFRDPAFIDSLAPEQRADFLEQPTKEEDDRYGQPEAERRAAERRAKLVTLKDKIRASSFPVVENYANPQALGERVLRDLTAIIDQFYPQGSEPAPLDREAMEHEAFAQSRARVYIGRQSYYDRLDEHAQSDSPPLVVLGESGAGKSALLANWALRYRAAHSEELLLLHFIGASPYSAAWAAMLRRVMSEFKRRFDIQQEIPDKPDELRAAFANWLHMAAAKGKVVLILDALNQLEDRDGAPDLVWLPPVIPANVRLIVSTLPGRALDDLKRRAWPTMQVEPLEASERKQLIKDYLGQHTKQLSTARAERLAGARQAANPLFLRALLDELRVFGIHEKLDERIEHYLTAANVTELYGKILERWEQDYERERPGLVRDAMSLLWAARRGLSETEVLQLLSNKAEPLPQAYWSPFYLAAEASLVSRSGLIGFGHEYLRRAIQNQYLHTERLQQNAHLRLVEFLYKSNLSWRKVDELPWQLARAGEFSKLFDLLGDTTFFPIIFFVDRASFKEYWALLKQDGHFKMADAYRPMIETPGEYLSVIGVVSTLLNETGHWSDCEVLDQRLIYHYRRTGERKPLSSVLVNQANLLIRRGNLSDAASLLEEGRELLDEESKDIRGWESWYGTAAMLTWERGDADESWRLLMKQERLLRKLGDKDRLCGCLIHKSFILHCRGEHVKALALLNEALRLSQEKGDAEGRQAVLGEMGCNYLSLGEMDRAAELFEQQADLCQQLGDPESRAGALGNLGQVHLARGDHTRAIALFEEMERIGATIGHGRIKHVGRMNQSAAYLAAGDINRSEELLSGVSEFFNSAGMFEPYSQSLRLAEGIKFAAKNARAHENPAEILEKAQKRALSDPTSADAQMKLGEAFERAGLSDEAVAAYRIALALRPRWAEVEVKLADLILAKEFNQ